MSCPYASYKGVSYLFPADLPQISSFNGQPLDDRSMPSNSDGPREFRTRARDIGAIIKVSWDLTNAQYATFEDFFEEDLLNGHRWFALYTPWMYSEDCRTAVRFNAESMYSANKIGYGGWRVVADLDVQNRLQPVQPE